jgi:hypothetical protein
MENDLIGAYLNDPANTIAVDSYIATLEKSNVPDNPLDEFTEMSILSLPFVGFFAFIIYLAAVL